MSIMNKLCYLLIIIVGCGLSFSFIYMATLSIQSFEDGKEAWIVNGTNVDTETTCVHESCSYHYVVNIYGYQYMNNSVIRHCTYSKEFSTEEHAINYANSQQPGEVHHWLEKNSICYTENMQLIIIIVCILIGSALFLCITTILFHSIYSMFTQQNAITNDEHIPLSDKLLVSSPKKNQSFDIENNNY